MTAIVAHRADLRWMYPAVDDVIDDINVALAPIDVHLPTFLPSIRPTLHAPLAITLRASPSLVVGFCCGRGGFIHGSTVPAIPFPLSRAKLFAVFFGGNAASPLGLLVFLRSHGSTSVQGIYRGRAGMTMAPHNARGGFVDTRMSPKRIARRKSARTTGDGPLPVAREEFDNVIKMLSEHGHEINELRAELQSTCRELAERVRQELQTQFTRIAQLQQEIDSLKRQNNS